ncbi:hypothetical protein [Geobacter sp. SVR]|uniref:hypothetical protein n=1 Tax=Geobacter sp. SVR TaxID=2495594 RepID=UPI00143EF9FF|nr:hypothetical protein [Geobacter sp. SVR]BCS51801.1 hypothetical protein GSVR_01090 [Geobacter sp. SVR]GCF87012.1 hypothetical protein GSbR_36120 [Geobacter sp. SVR]
MNSLITQSLCMAGLLALCAGCSHESWTNVEETTRLPSMAAPILAPVNWVTKAGRAVTSKSSESSDSDRGKQFVLSRRVMDDFSSDGKFMEEVLAVQSRFRAHDWGSVTPEQLQANSSSNRGKGSVGRYPTGSKGAAIIITDEGSEFKVRYEDEPEQ